MRLAPKTTSFTEWTRRLASLADSPDLRGEINYWTKTAAEASTSGSFVFDHRTGDNDVASCDTVSLCLDSHVTRQWLVDSQAAYRTRPHELLIAALAETLCNHGGGDTVGIDLESHGREDLLDGVDLSRTVGWFTSLYPVALRRPSSTRPGDTIKSIKEQLRTAPRGGIGYGVLRWLAGDAHVHDALAAIPWPATGFNYLGHFDELRDTDAAFTLANESTGPDRGSRNARPHAWEIIAHVRDGRLHVDWQFSKNLHRRETVARLADEFLAALGRLVEHCLSPGAGGATPSDFPLAGIDQEEVNRLAVLFAEADQG